MSMMCRVATRPNLAGVFALCVLAQACVPDRYADQTAVADAAAILDVFPASTVKISGDDSGQCLLTETYYESGSLWAETLNEQDVFFSEIRRVADDDSSFALRIGKGGQIYSLRGAFGESIPPSSPGSPWNDEVWQFVSVCLKYNGMDGLTRSGSVPDDVLQRIQTSGYENWYFIHNSGAYMEGAEGVNNLYCPMLADAETGDARGYRTVNWGLVPQVRTIHRSPLLYYVQTRDVGGGVIEMTWVVHNFSVRDDIVFDHLNAPWGGTRISSLPYHYLSTPDGGLMTRKEIADRGIANGIDVRMTGGWNISSASDDAESPSLALVFGRDRHLEDELTKANSGDPHVQYAHSIYRDWDATAGQGYGFVYQDWQTRPENTWRNYEVAVVIPKFRLAPGSTIWYRSYLVVDGRDRAIETAKSLVEQVDYGLLTFDRETTPLLPVTWPGSEDVPSFRLYARPVPGSMPVFLIENATTGQPVITTDPYIFVKKEKLDFELPSDHPLHGYYQDAIGYSVDQHNSRWRRLLGFGLVNRPDDSGFLQIGDAVPPAMFPRPDTHHLNLWAAPIEGATP